MAEFQEDMLFKNVSDEDAVFSWTLWALNQKKLKSGLKSLVIFSSIK